MRCQLGMERSKLLGSKPSPENPMNPMITGGGGGGSMKNVQESMKQNVQDILWSIMFGAGDVRLMAAREIRRLTKTSAKTRVYLAAAGVIPPLVLMLKSSCQDSREAALLALLNLAVGNERNKIKIVKSGAVAPLVDLLQSEGPALRESAAAAIYTLSAASSNKPLIGASGATPLLVEMLTSGSVQGKVDAVMALYNLSTLPANLPSILASRPVAPLLLLLKSCKKSGNVADKATSLLESLARFDDARASIGKVEGGILTLVEVLEDGSSKSREHAVGTLLALCQSDRRKFREAILHEGVIPGLLELTVQGTARAQQMAHTLLELLRESPARSSNVAGSPSMIESLVCDIASHVDASEDESSAGTARKMLTEMVQLSMEQSMRHLQQRALVRAPSSVSSDDPSSSPRLSTSE